MIINLNGRKAIVTGSTVGIGRAIAEGLARAGASVVINGRGEERVAKALQEMRQQFPEATLTGVAADLATTEGVASFIAQVADADILVNNLGTLWPKPFAELTDSDWLNIFQINVMSGVRLTRQYLPEMVKRRWGRVVFINSGAALQIPIDMIHYSMTKTAQLAISRGLAETVAGTGVTVNAVIPGPTRSEILPNIIKAMAEPQGISSQEEGEQHFLKTKQPTSLIKRLATTDEVANMVVYVCSEQASATTGAALRVDGGVVRFIV